MIANESHFHSLHGCHVLLPHPLIEIIFPVPASSRARPLPQGWHKFNILCSTCGSGHAREEAGTGNYRIKVKRPNTVCREKPITLPSESSASSGSATGKLPLTLRCPSSPSSNRMRPG